MRYRVPMSLAAAFLASVPATAKTPDGQTPAVETVCDEYRGAAYGLCVSYCEARDCDDPRSRASERSCEATARVFERKTGEALVCSPEPLCDDFVAEDDFVDLTGQTSPVVRDLLANDAIPEGDVDVVVTASPPDPVEVDAEGVATITFDEETAWELVEFTYTACCDDGLDEPVCDDAIVSVVGC